MIKRIKISKSATLAIEKLKEYGYSAYVVGGAVRDALLDKDVSDFDVTTSATPKEVTEVFKGYPTILTGEKHGTVTVLLPDPVEITTFRADGEYEDMRRPSSVEFVRSLEEDLKRRDFTINALAYDEKGEIIDLYGGISDLNDRVIRAVGNPEKRFQEDALRILRAVRFSAVLGFRIEKETLCAAIKLKKNLKAISKERIFSELVKTLTGEFAVETLIDYPEIIFEIIPEIEPCYKFDQHNKNHLYDVYEHIVRSVGLIESEDYLRLAMFFHDIGKPEKFFIGEDRVGHFYDHASVSAKLASDVLKRIKAPNRLINSVVWLVKNHHLPLDVNEIRLKKMLSENGEDRIFDLIKVKRADAMAKGTNSTQISLSEVAEAERVLNEIVNRGDCYSLSALSVKGEDLKALGLEGEAIGEMLNSLLDDVICGNLKNDKEKLLLSAKKRLKKKQK